MAQSYFNLTLDTLPPSGLSVQINGEALYTASTAAMLGITVSDAVTTGYQMKIWGVSGAASEAEASWETFAASKSVTLPAGDGLKTVSVKVRDDVGNETAAATASITLDTAVPVISITGPDIGTISKASGFDTAVASFTVDSDFVEYKVCAVPAANSLVTAGTVIPTTAGSINTSGTGNFPADTLISVTIKGADLESASPGDGVKIVKVFAKDKAGNWSVA